ncbi:MAG TPA: DNA polymerase III subunit chi [Steroidobacteraceae bacterium]|nr:DNA polymerase III subunit chi [Steroidobacteraceae bacterium]
MTAAVDFYISNGSRPEQRRLLACRLTEKAYLASSRVIIWMGSEADARACDELLWTFDDRAFVPHRISRGAELTERSTPVHLTLALDSVDGADLLINLADRLPEGLPRFARIAEIIDADEERRRLGRERFKAYRDRKLPLQTFECRDGAEPGPHG